MTASHALSQLSYIPVGWCVDNYSRSRGLRKHFFSSIGPRCQNIPSHQARRGPSSPCAPPWSPLPSGCSGPSRSVRTRPPAHGLTESDFVEGDGSAGYRDGDGVPDPEDIIVSARAYTAMRPRYGSAYYEGGPPADSRGVCTDLLAAPQGRRVGLAVPRGRGHPRRPRGLWRGGAGPGHRLPAREERRRLPGDPCCLADARPLRRRRVACGDIAVFSDHVAVVSDVRDGDGVPYLIHHEGPLRRSFEEDVLASRPDLVGHFRL